MTRESARAGASAMTRESARAVWHRRAAVLPLGYLAVAGLMVAAHRLIPDWRWLAAHLLLLGATSNAIVIWSGHFTTAVLGTAPAASRRPEALRLGVLNLGVAATIVGQGIGRPGLAIGGAGVTFAAIAAHGWWLAATLRAARPAPLAIAARYYLTATVALLTGIPAGAWLLVGSGTARPRLLLFHAHLNLFGWVTLTVLGTLVLLWPTVLGTRMPDRAIGAAIGALPTAASGVALLGIGLLAWWPPLAASGLAVLALAGLVLARPAVTAARRKPPAGFAAWSIAAAIGWLLIAIVLDAWNLLTAPGPEVASARFRAALPPFLAGFVGQVLLGALAFLLPMALGGGPAAVRARIGRLEWAWPQRLTLTNGALVLLVLPAPRPVHLAAAGLVIVALAWFLVSAASTLASANPPAARSSPMTPRTSLGGAAVGLALVGLAALVGAAGERWAEGPPGAPDRAERSIRATGQTTTVEVSAEGLRFRPSKITVPAGNRLVINLINRDQRGHDLVLDTGARTPIIAKGDRARLDAGVVRRSLDGWCSVTGHRQAGMVLTVTATGGGAADPAADPAADQRAPSAGPGDHADHPAGPRIDPLATPGAGFVARDATAPVRPESRTHRVELRVQEIVAEVAPGVRQRLWTFNGTAPGPVLRGGTGDVFEITLINEGSLDHGVDFHAGALAPDRPMRPIDPGERLTYRFTAGKAGIWMYHCSTMPMLHHIGNGMYGAVIIDPPDLPAVADEYVLVQSEWYLGPDGEPGDLAKMRADQPDAVVFNGYVGQYAHQPLTAAAGARVRVWVLNAGPSRSSAFHIVGTTFDTVYQEGHWQLRPTDPGAGQVLALAPSAGGFVETVFPEPGRYPFVSHSMIDAERGARGVVAVS